MIKGYQMAISIQRGKYRIQVSLTPEEYRLLRWMAYERELTVNELLRVVTVSVAEDYRKNG